ncbi:MAG: hypothetical protein JNK64_08300 [Myxococcales bacterium]|nr:hypothetical protein [Myxococcales bacterium]
MTQIATQGTLRSHLADAPWPVDFFAPADLPGFLDRIYVVESLVRWRGDEHNLRLQLAFEGEVAVRLPGLDGVSLVFGGDPLIEGVTLIGVQVKMGRRPEVVFDQLSFALRFDRELLTPAPDETGQVAEHAQIYVTGSIAIDDNFDVQVRGFDAIELTPVMLGSSGIVLSASGVKLDLSRTTALPEVLAAGFGEDFLGVFVGEAKVRFPDNFPSLAPEDLVLRDAAIGSGGVSGTLVASYTPMFDDQTQRFTGPGAGELGGVPFGLREADIAVRRNGFERARLAGDLLLPFFDLPVEVEVGLTLDGGLTVALSRDEDLITLRREGVVEVVVDSLGFVVDGDGLTTRLSGTVRPLIGGLAWPGFEVRELEIDSRGNVRCDGGWIDLPTQYALDFHGFATELTKLGFGRDDDGGRWIAVSGSLQLGAELRAGASLDGLRVTWYGDGRPPRLGLDGIDVELDLPEVLRFRGRVGYRELPGPVHRFDGGIALELLALDLRLDAQLVIGTGPNGSPFLGIHLAGDLPGGIPLWATGLSLYGLSGLFALNLTPDRAADEPWYDGWYKRAPLGATELTKWAWQDGARGFGAGLTVGTTVDNGFTLAARTSVILLFPGPIVLIEGRANLFHERARLSDEPAFTALAVLDKQSDTFLVGLTARYQQGADGRLIDIGGRAEGFFRLSSGDDWHLYLGERTPPDRRIKAKALSLFEADAYLMIDPDGLALGASAGWDKQWKFGPLRVSLSASIAADAAVSWRPLHFHGEVGVHGAVGLRLRPDGVGRRPARRRRLRSVPPARSVPRWHRPALAAARLQRRRLDGVGPGADLPGAAGAGEGGNGRALQGHVDLAAAGGWAAGAARRSRRRTPAGAGAGAAAGRAATGDRAGSAARCPAPHHLRAASPRRRPRRGQRPRDGAGARAPRRSSGRRGAGAGPLRAARGRARCVARRHLDADRAVGGARPAAQPAGATASVGLVGPPTGASRLGRHSCGPGEVAPVVADPVRSHHSHWWRVGRVDHRPRDRPAVPADPGAGLDLPRPDRAHRRRPGGATVDLTRRAGLHCDVESAGDA